MHRSVGTCFVRNILSSSKIVKRQMAAQNTVGFQSKFWLLPRRAAAPTSAAASTGAVHTAAWCWGSQKLVTYSLCSLFSVQCYLQTETQDWMVWPLSRKVIFREQFWHWNLVVQYAGLPFPVNRNMTERGLMASINIPAGFSNFFTGIRCLKKLL